MCNFSIFFPAMSENYVVFIEQPIKMDLIKILTSRIKGKGINDCIYWDPKQETVFHVVNKQTGQVKPKSLFNVNTKSSYKEKSIIPSVA